MGIVGGKDEKLMLHIIPILLQQGLEAGMVAEGVLDRVHFKDRNREPGKGPLEFLLLKGRSGAGEENGFRRNPDHPSYLNAGPLDYRRVLPHPPVPAPGERPDASPSPLSPIPHIFF